MMGKTDEKGKGSLMSVLNIYKPLNIGHPYERVQVYVDGAEVDHSDNNIFLRFYNLLAESCHAGDRFYTLENKWQSLEENNDAFLKPLGHSVISIGTDSDGGFGSYDLNECGNALDDDGCEIEAYTPLYFD